MEKAIKIWFDKDRKQFCLIEPDQNEVWMYLRFVDVQKRLRSLFDSQGAKTKVTKGKKAA